jgi:hypothetical protein
MPLPLIPYGGMAVLKFFTAISVLVLAQGAVPSLRPFTGDWMHCRLSVAQALALGPCRSIPMRPHAPHVTCGPMRHAAPC